MRVRLTPEALEELDQVLEFLKERSPKGAKLVRARIRKVLQTLKDNPGAGRQTDLPGIRRIVTSPYPYLIFYQTEDREVRVIAIRHGARDPQSMPDAETEG